MPCVMAVTSDQLKWLPAGSEMPPDSKTKFTSFGCSQDSLPAFTSEAIASRYPDIVLAKLRPGQVWNITSSCMMVHLECLESV
jgi:DNA-directed RNA polymerase I and III subunit RPAC1